MTIASTNDLSHVLPVVGTYVRVRTLQGDEFSGTVMKSGATNYGLASRLDTGRHYIPHLGDILLYSGVKPASVAPSPKLVEPGREPIAPVVKRGGNYVEREVRKAWFWTGVAILFSLAVIGGLLRG